MDIDLTPLVQALAAFALAATAAVVPIWHRCSAATCTFNSPRPWLRQSSPRRPPGAGGVWLHCRKFSQLLRPDYPQCRTRQGRAARHRLDPRGTGRLGVTPQHVRNMVEARFGGLLAADPNVSIGSPPAA